MIEFEASLAWLFVPPERLPAQLPPGDSSMVDLGYLQARHPSRRLAGLKLLRDKVGGGPWWETLGNWAECAVEISGDHYQWTSDALKYGWWLDRLPPDLLLGFHPSADAANVDNDEATFSSAVGGPRADLHCHLSATIPEPALWRALMSGAMQLKEGVVEHEEPWITQEPHRWALEAAMLRLDLAAAVVPGPLASWYRKSPAGDATPKMGWNDLIEFLDDARLRLDPAESPFKRYADPVAVALSLRPHGPAGEIRLLIEARARARTDANIEAKLARYAVLRCALRGYLVLQPEGEGLLRFAGRLGQWPQDLFGRHQERASPSTVDPSPGAQVERAGWIWLGQIAARAQVVRGASASELRVDLVHGVSKPGAVARARKRLVALLEGFHAGGPNHAVGFIQQLHRNEGPNKLAEVARHAREVAGLQHGEYLLGIDLVGNEPLYAATRFREAYMEAEAPAGWSRCLHIGEDFLHPLTALRWLAWCLRELKLGPTDRLGHVLILSEARDREPAITHVRTRALDLAWAHEWAPNVASELFASLMGRIARSHVLEPIQSWIDWLSKGGHEAHLQLGPASTVSLDPPCTDERLLLQRIRADLVREIHACGVVLECCPTSNRRVSGLAASSLPILGRHTKHLRWVLGSDDPGLLATGLGREWRELVEAGIPERSRNRLVSLDSLVASRLRLPVNPRDVEVSDNPIDDRRLPTASARSSGERWSDAETTLLESLHGRNIEPVLMSRHFAAAGFARTPTALRRRMDER